MAAIISARPAMAQTLSTPLHWANDAQFIVTEAIKAINERPDHVMRRHQEIVEWRWSEGDTTPKPMALCEGLPAAIAAEVKQFSALPAETRATLINNYGTKRMESPAEKVRRIHRPQAHAAIPADTYLDLMMDAATATYKGGDVLDVVIKRGGAKQIFRFTGPCHQLTLGQEVQVRWNSDRASAGAWVHDHREAFITYLQFARDPRMLSEDAEDLELLQGQLGAKNKALSQVLALGRRAVARLPETRAELGDRDRDIAALSTLAATLPPPATVAAALPESADLARVVLNTKSRQHAPTIISDADAYLMEDDDEA